jgi:hypothetical protein
MLQVTAARTALPCRTLLLRLKQAIEAMHEARTGTRSGR